MTSNKSQPFSGFPAGAEAVPIPAAMLTAVFPQVEDAAELVVSLYAAAAVQRQRRYPRLVEVEALRAERALIETLASVCPNDEVDAAFRRGLDSAVARGTVLAMDARDASGERAVLTLNSTGDRKAVERIQRGELRRSVPWELVRRPAPEARGDGIYALYESVVGPITPGIGQELAEAEGLYPREWIVDAFRESEELNKRNWRYVKRILERWDREGRDDEATGRRDRRQPDSRFEHLIRR
ncbi:MAG TPA: DnaD domain protein [Dehalococcoidia bacterium]|nr:DnaD domain protein [Dehalococcoidia bacterium]